MPLEQDVLDIGRQLEKLVSEGKSNNDTANDLLNRLKDLPITLDILQKTRIGMAVNVVRKASTKEDVQTVAKALIKSWKRLLDNQAKIQRQSSQENSSESPSNLNHSASASSLQRSASASSLQRSDSNSSSSSSVHNGKSSNFSSSSKPSQASREASRVKDPIRNRCIDMIASSLKCAERSDFDASSLSAEIEDAIFRIFKDTGTKYKNRVKSRVMNLRDKRNVQLRLLVIDGDLSTDRFANMTAEEMACDDLKKERIEMTQQLIKDHQLAKTAGTSTGQFKCGKCGKRNTTYSQVQTRSADEPMTTFVYCQECGNRWRFC